MNFISKSEVFEASFKFLAENLNGVLEIVGPTGSGKTDLTVKIVKYLEEKLNKSGEIIVVDSRQVYMDCDISSAKITEDEMQGIKHWGIDLVSPEEEYNVVRFQKYAVIKIREILARGNFPVLSGGTMLWLDAVSENYIFAENKGDKSLKKGMPIFPFYKIGIEWDRQILYDRINKRAKNQFNAGLVEETQRIIEQYKCTKSMFTSFGYLEILQYLNGEISREKALELNQQRNRKYAKRQLTWWRGREDVNWVRGEDL